MCLFKCEFKWFWWLSHEVAIYFNIYILRIRMFDHDYDVDFHLTMMLHSTTSPYGWPVIEVAYGEMIFLLHQGCMGVDSLGRVIGASAWCITHVWHTQVNTSVGLVYILFFWFLWYKNLYICILFSKSICSIKEHWWSLTLSWPDEDQRMFSTAHEILNVKLKPKTVLWWFYTRVLILIMLLGCNYEIFN